MNNWKLRSTITGQDGMDFVEVNGHLASLDSGEDCLVNIVPFGDKYPYYLRNTESSTFGPVSNQVPGICNGTFTHTGAASGTVASTVIEGQGTSTPTFTYTFLADGTLSTIVAAQAGDRNIRVGDKYQITTNEGHVIQFRLVDGSNDREISIRLIYNQGVLPYAVKRVRIREATDHTIQVLDYRSSQVFPRPQNKLLDKYPDAAAAYGLRKLRSAYLGPAIRVRKNVTGAPEKDIFFDSQGNLDTKTLLDFAGDETLLVKIFHDQSGNGNDASQTTSASMPKIVDAGTLVTVNGKPALDFDGSDDGFSADHSDLYGQGRLDAYMHYQTDDNKYIMLDDSGAQYSFVPVDNDTATTINDTYGTDPDLYVNGVKAALNYGTTTRDQLHAIMVEQGAEHSNGAVVVHEGAATTGWTGFGISGYNNFEFDGKMTEMVLYNTDQSANRENIEKDMALHSGAYQVEDAPLLDAYGGAHAAYSLRKLNSDYTGAAIRVVKISSSPYPEQDIGFDADGNLDLDALDTFLDGYGGNVKTWYDQSGNGNDVTQTAIGSSPNIQTSAGNLQKVDGRVALRFDGINDALPFDSTGLDIGNMSSFAVGKFNNTTGTQYILAVSGNTGGNARWQMPVLYNGDFNYAYGGNVSGVSTDANTNNNLHSMIAGATQTDMEAFLNGTSVGTLTLTTGIDSAVTGVGALGTSGHMNGYIQEVVVYSSDQSERRQGIERNISNHYDL